jgi:hypothetical protein
MTWLRDYIRTSFGVSYKQRGTDRTLTIRLPWRYVEIHLGDYDSLWADEPDDVAEQIAREPRWWS